MNLAIDIADHAIYCVIPSQIAHHGKACSFTGKGEVGGKAKVSPLPTMEKPAVLQGGKRGVK